MRTLRCTIVALALVVAGAAACGNDEAGGTTATTTTTDHPASTTTAAITDSTAAVDELCAKTDEFQALLRERVASQTEGVPTSQGDDRVSEVASEALQMVLDLQPLVPQMLPGDAARFQECADVVGGVPSVTAG